MGTIEFGQGEPLVVIPGLQGRWQYARPAIRALAHSRRVITFPLCGEPGAACKVGPGEGLDAYVRQIEAVLDLVRLPRAAVCGVSFGGLAALRMAATRPHRISALVLVSTPGPGFRLNRRHRFYVRWPRLCGLLFAAETPLRLRPELAASFPSGAERRAFVRSQIRTFAEAPLSAVRMAERAALIEGYDRADDCRRVTCPTLVVRGEPGLDRVVDALDTARYAELIAAARLVTLAGTGHLGSLTRPLEFSAAVEAFLSAPGKDRRHSAA